MAEVAHWSCVHRAGCDRDGVIRGLVCGGVRVRTDVCGEECGDGRGDGRRHRRTERGIQR